RGVVKSATLDSSRLEKPAGAQTRRSEASLRLSRGTHPATVKPAAARAAQLLTRHAGGAVCAGEVDCYPAVPPPRVIDLPMSEVTRILGMDFPIAEAERILTALDFRVEKRGESLRATASPNRLDIQDGPANLIEDLARLYGYD